MSPDAVLTAHPTATRYHATEFPAPGDPLAAATRLVESGISETHVVYEKPGSWAVALGALTEITVTPGAVVRVDADGERTELAWTSTPLDALTAVLDDLAVEGWRAYGWAGFELAYAHTGLSELVSDQRLAHLVVPHTEVRIAEGRAHVRSTEPELLDFIRDLLSTPDTERDYRPQPIPVEHAGADAYRAAVADAVQEIKDRVLQKVILSRVVEVEQPVDLVGTYTVGRRANSPARSFMISVDGLRAAGFSPEIVVSVDGSGWVTTQPLAGTRRLADSAADNDGLRDDLFSDTKEIFEHAISVKVSWEELTGLCVPGTVVVNDYMTVKERGSVQHLASAVSGQLPAGTSPWQAFGALFPAVTASGVPKRAAYRAIHRHESHPRGLYSGAVLTVDQSGELDAALVLRTIFQQDGRTWLRAGAGIVEQSRPERELEETCEKLRSVALHVVPAAQ
ncbi:salicylate synthase [Actinokineospora soli]